MNAQYFVFENMEWYWISYCWELLSHRRI